MKTLKNLTTTYTINWLVKIACLGKVWRPKLILVSVFFGCNTTDFGAEINLDTNVDVSVVDFNLPTSNLYIDSLRTDGENRVLVGKYSDPLTGDIDVEGFFGFLLTSGTLPIATQTESEPNPQDTLRYDSLKIFLHVNDVLPNTDIIQSLDVVELDDSLFSRVVYLASTPQNTMRHLGSFSMELRPDMNNILEVRLDDTYGNELFEKISEASKDSLRTPFDLRYKAIGVMPAPSTKSIVNINLDSDDTVLRLYMSGGADSIYRMNFRAAINEYTHVVRNNSMTPFSPIIENENFDLPDGTTVLDPLAGITTSFSLEQLLSFFAENDQIIINLATIELDIHQDLPRDSIDILRFYFRKNNGGIFGPGFSTSLYAFSNLVMTDNGYLNLNNDPAHAKINEDKYTVSPTLFFQSLYLNYQATNKLAYINPFNEDTVNISDLVIASPVNNTLQQTIFKNSGVKLRVFYTEVN